jgi:PAS domain S-box-containing protein
VPSDVDTLRALFDACPDAILLVGDDRRYVMANAAACRLLGYTRPQILALSVEDVATVSAALADRMWQELLRTGDQAGTTRLRRADGAQVEVEFRALANVLPGRHLSIMRDVSEGSRREEAAVLRRGLDRILAPPMAADALERALALCCVGRGWELGVLWQPDGQPPVMRFVCGWTSPALRPHRERLLRSLQDVRVRSGEHTLGSVFAADAPRWVLDLRGDSSVLLRAEYEEADLGSAVAIPVRHEGAVVGVVSLCSRSVQAKDPRFMAAMCDALEPVGAALVRASDGEGETTGPATTSEQGLLTEREREILRLVAEGRSSTTIAKTLFISTRTVDTHRKNIMSKLGIRTIAGLTRFAIRHGISPLT